MTEEFEKRIGVGAIIHNEDGKILLGIRDVEDNRGKWELFGGLALPGEQLTDAIKREVREEAGIEIEPLVIVAHYIRSFPEKRQDNYGFCYTARYISGEPHITEHGRIAGFKWVRFDKAMTMELTEYTRLQLEQYDAWTELIEELVS
jgi:8-oxo-dGTP diphosphatase